MYDFRAYQTCMGQTQLILFWTYDYESFNYVICIAFVQSVTFMGFLFGFNIYSNVLVVLFVCQKKGVTQC
jgi:hypothetical protein